jgi:hypothetical protein
MFGGGFVKAAVSSVSCASAGNCSAGGYVTDPSIEAQLAFVVSEVNGKWQKAEVVPGIGAATAGFASVASVACASAGNCSAGGSYRSGPSSFQAFVVSEVRGRWAKAKEVPGTATLNKGGNATITSVSCAAPGNCSAGGNYSNGNTQAFVVSEAKGSWGKAEEVPGTAALNTGGHASINSVSCASANRCSAGGYYGDGATPEGFVVSKT